METGAATTIDLDGLYSVYIISVTNGAPQYTFGTATNQVIPLESVTDWYKSGKFLIAQNAEMPVLKAALSVGSASTTRDTMIHIVNNNNAPLVINDIGYLRRSATDGWGFGYLYLEGNAGGYTLAGSSVRGEAPCMQGLIIYIYCAAVKVTGNYNSVHAIGGERGNGTVVTIEEGASLTYGSLNGNNVLAEQNLTIAGEGTFAFHSNPFATPDGNRARFATYTGRTLKLSCKTFSLLGESRGVPAPLRLYSGYTTPDTNGGVLEMATDYTGAGEIQFIDGYDRTYRTDRMERLGTAEKIRFWATRGIVEMTAATNMVFDRTFSITNGGGGMLANGGAGTLSAEMNVVIEGADDAAIELGFKAETAPIILKPTITKAEGQSVSLTVAGASRLVVPTFAALTPYAGVRLSGGTLELPVEENWTQPTTLPITYDTGIGSIVVPDGQVYTFTTLAPTEGKTEGTLNFALGTGRAKFTGATLPARVTVNGAAAEVRADGYLAPVITADHKIAAKGDSVPNVPGESVAITTAGSGADDTLAADVTTVGELIQGVLGASATIEIGSGRTLKADKVTTYPLSGTLNVGAANEAGTFAAANGTVQLERNETLNDLVIRAQVAGDTRVVVDGGAATPTLAGGSAAGSSLLALAGEIKLTGEKTFNFDFMAAGTNRDYAVVAGSGAASTDETTWPTIRFDGAKDVRIGERGLQAGYPFITLSGHYQDLNRCGRLVFTNTLVRSSDMERGTYPIGPVVNEAYSIVVGSRCSGYMEVQDGAVISNRLMVGAPIDGGPGMGVLVQTGGEMATLGTFGTGSSYNYGSGVGFVSAGYYQLDEGKLVNLGPFVVGMQSSAFACLHQRGGTWQSAAHPADTSASPGRNLYIAGGNNSIAVLRQSGGTADFTGNVCMSAGWYGGDYPSSAYWTIDGTANVDAHDHSIALIYTGSTAMPLQALHYGIVNLNGKGVLRAAGFYQNGRQLAEHETTNDMAIVNANGGTFKTGMSDKKIFHIATGSDKTTFCTRHVFLYDGGFTVDTDGQTGNEIDIPLTGATGGGIAAIAYAPSETARQYVMPPLVRINGDGTGATAVAEWDSTNKCVTGITITSPGVGYTKATAEILLPLASHRILYDETVPCTIAENANAGSFTKAGEGDLTLSAVNTYGGETILKGGVLKATCAGAIPEGTTIRYQGGTLEATAAAVPAAFTVAFEGAAGQHSLDVLTVTGETSLTKRPMVTVLGQEDKTGWQTRLKNNVLQLYYKRATVIVIR